jgi:hypothetical protein
VSRRRKYYLCELIFEGNFFFVIWFSDRRDGLLVDKHKKIRHFRTENDAIGFLELRNHVIENDPIAKYNIDAINTWCIEPNSEHINCNTFLDMWNFFTDMSASIGRKSTFKKADNGLQSIYDKFFWGCNLPAITPKEKHFAPGWTVDDVKAIAELFRVGIIELQKNMSLNKKIAL